MNKRGKDCYPFVPLLSCYSPSNQIKFSFLFVFFHPIGVCVAICRELGVAGRVFLSFFWCGWCSMERCLILRVRGEEL